MFPFEHLVNYSSKPVEVCNIWKKYKDDKTQKDFRITKKVPESKHREMLWISLPSNKKHFPYITISISLKLHKFQCPNNNLNPGKIIISENFSENYSIKHYGEIISAHWSAEAIFLCCATAHYLDGNNKNRWKIALLNLII